MAPSLSYVISKFAFTWAWVHGCGRTQDFENALLGLTQDELNEMDVDAIIEMVRAADEAQDVDDEGGGEARGGVEQGERHRLSAHELEGLTSHTATDNDSRLHKESECSVCLAGMRSGEQISVLACAHTFHHACIVRWLARSRRCPYCRSEVMQSQTS